MAYTVIYEDEKGNSLRSFSQDIDLPFSSDLEKSSYPLLKYLDPYGDTTFNQLMLADLLLDLQRLQQEGTNLSNLIKFVTACRGETHTYLKIYGD